ncbi:squalene/phytoene synthase family protein [Roseovarius sp. LXJ103]|uniref:squalene/phytoene synthase family protein n=1 Tax=Roseovarius carneus TaxID=2853164 RepID=UPI000D6146E1|nr:squalene/phytoene synthase family protein [Roseovarius carneus]MBZ8118553.1 squalene/phytoene synthase family protein [Roseovarius carneus]PWE35755.1 phytoene synthase [Pelagicola sp. LXJ1103]
MRSTGSSCAVNDDLRACADIVRRGDPERFAAAMAAPVAARAVLFPVYAFNVEVARAPWLTAEPMIAEMRLQWWREALEEIGVGGPVRRHEVTTPLAGVLDAEGVALLDALIAARRWDIYKDPFEDAAHFEQYLTRTSGHLMLAAARALGGVDEAAVLDVGYASGLANYLRAIPALEAAGRVPLLDGRPQGLRDLAQNGLARLGKGRAARKSVPKPAAPALYAAWLAGPVLRRAAAHPALVGQGALDPAPAAARLRLMGVAMTGRW